LGPGQNVCTRFSEPSEQQEEDASKNRVSMATRLYKRLWKGRVIARSGSLPVCNQEIQHSIRDIDTHATHTYQSTSDYEQRLKGRTYQVAPLDSCHIEIELRQKRSRIGDVVCEVVLPRSWKRCDAEIIVKVGRIDETRARMNGSEGRRRDVTLRHVT
jgi:hypothetical protein